MRKARVANIVQHGEMHLGRKSYDCTLDPITEDGILKRILERLIGQTRRARVGKGVRATFKRRVVKS